MPGSCHFLLFYASPLPDVFPPSLALLNSPFLPLVWVSPFWQSHEGPSTSSFDGLILPSPLPPRHLIVSETQLPLPSTSPSSGTEGLETSPPFTSSLPPPSKYGLSFFEIRVYLPCLPLQISTFPKFFPSRLFFPSIISFLIFTPPNAVLIGLCEGALPFTFLYFRLLFGLRGPSILFFPSFYPGNRRSVFFFFGPPL